MVNVLDLLGRFSFWLAPIFYKVLYLSITAALVGAVIFLVGKVLDNKISPLWKYLLWSVMLVALLVPVRPYSSFSLVGSLETVQDISYREEYEDAHAALVQTEQSLDSAAETQQIQEMRHREQRAYWKTIVFDMTIPLVWLIGLVSAAAFFAWNRIQLMQKLRGQTMQDEDISRLMQQCKQEMGVQRDIPVLMPEFVNSPALTGFIAPKILLPHYAKQMDAAELRFVLLHELGHYRRKDLWLNELLLLLQCVHWFNPVIWYLFQQVRADIEVLNDSFVLKKIGMQQSKAYAKSLVTVLGYSHKIALVPRLLSMTDGKKNVERRIGMIRMSEKFKKYRVWIAAVGVLVIAGIALLFLTTKPLTPQQAADMLIGSIKKDDNAVSFTIPKGYSPVEDWSITVTSSTPLPENTIVNQYFFTAENEKKTWEKGKTYTVPLDDPDNTNVILTVALPGGVERTFQLIPGVDKIEEQPSTAIRFDVQQRESMMEFRVVAQFPDSWETRPYDESVYLPGNFTDVLAIYDGDTPIAAIGYSEFTPYEDEIEPENYYKTVYPDLRLSSIFGWDEYQPVKVTETGETAVTNIWYNDPKELDNYMGAMPDCPVLETSGILSYDKDLQVYVGIAFDAEQITQEEVEALAKTLEIRP